MGRRGSKILSFKVGLIVYVCVCVCVWGGGGGDIVYMRKGRTAASLPVKVSKQRERTFFRASSKRQTRSLLQFFSCNFQVTDWEPSTY